MRMGKRQATCLFNELMTSSINALFCVISVSMPLLQQHHDMDLMTFKKQYSFKSGHCFLYRNIQFEFAVCGGDPLNCTLPKLS